MQRDLSAKRHVYFWAGGVYFQPHLEHDKQCQLVVTGADEIGNKDIVGLSDGYRESEQSCFELLFDLKRRGPQLLFFDAFLHLAAQAVEALVKRLTFADEVGDHEARAGALVCFLLSNRFKDKRSTVPLFRELSAPGRIVRVSGDPFPQDRPGFKKHRETTGPDAVTERHCARAATNRIPSTAGPDLTSRQSGFQAVTAPASGRRAQRKEPAMANSTETRTPSSPRSGAEPDRSIRLPGRKRGAAIAEPGAATTCPPVRRALERGRPS